LPAALVSYGWIPACWRVPSPKGAKKGEELFVVPLSEPLLASLCRIKAGRTLCEDASRIRRNPGIFARIRSFAYNILRFNQSDTIVQDRYAAALGGLKSLFAMNFYKER
jgi:hypothetical protein